MDDGILRRGERLIIPESLQSRVIQLAHEGHFGMTMMKRRLRQYYWWPSMDRHIELTVKNCSYCAESDKPYKCQTPPLTPVPLPERVWQKVAMDIMGPFPDGKHKFAIVLVDYYSKWCEVSFVNEVTTTKVKEFLIKVFPSESYPEFLVTDNGDRVESCNRTQAQQQNSKSADRAGNGP